MACAVRAVRREIFGKSKILNRTLRKKLNLKNSTFRVHALFGHLIMKNKTRIVILFSFCTPNRKTVRVFFFSNRKFDNVVI